MDGETCRLCGGDGRIGNALGRSSATCPSCHGSGRRTDTSAGFHDVTKTKPSHYRPAVAAPAGPRGPATPEGVQLALDVNSSTILGADAKARLVAEIVNHESTHGRCTKTFLKKIRKQAKPGG
jgi:hypothetical protein